MGFSSNILHIYGQKEPHDDAFIYGDKQALTALRDAIDKALKDGESEIDTFDKDGEGYRLYVFKCSATRGYVNSIFSTVLPYEDK